MKTSAWITNYLAKKGKDMTTLEKALLRMTREEIVRKAGEVGIEISIGRKAEMVKAVLSGLEGEAVLVREEKETEYSSPYFKDRASELIFYLLNGQGPDRTFTLHITKDLYRNPDRAAEWRDEILNVIDPDVCHNPMAEKAVEMVNRTYDRMIAR